MSKRKKLQQRNYWQSVAYDAQSVNLWYDHLIELALSRFKWEGLPETCDAEFLERTLLFEGCATIACKRVTDEETGIKRNTKFWYSTKAVQQNTPNIYQNPTAWDSYGNNGWRFSVDNGNGVWIWDNKLRNTITPKLDLLAHRLAHIDRVKDANLAQQLNPLIITCPDEMRQTVMNIYRNAAVGQPVIIGYNNLRGNIETQPFLAVVPYIGNELQTAQDNLLNQALSILGIENLPKKSERMIEDEVTAHDEHDTIARLSPLEERRKAAKILNNRFDMNVTVNWNDDFISRNWQFINDIQSRMEVSENGD